MKRTAGLFAVIMFICNFALQAQRISVSAKDATLESLITQIEGQSEIRFYYLPAWIDTVDVTVQQSMGSVTAILEEALANSGINYFIYGNQVILTPGIIIQSPTDNWSGNPSPRTPTRFTREFKEERTANITNVTRDVGRQEGPKRDSYTVSGYIREKGSGEPLTGVLIYQKNTTNAVTSDQFGFYTIKVPAGEQLLVLDLLGMKSINQKLNVLSDGKLDFVMEESVTQLKEVVVESDMDQNVNSVQMGVMRLDVRAMKTVPRVLGENDIFKVATTIPGVKTVGEGASGVNVRGGHADQNLVILNEATIYNTSHFLGFFSIFNADAIRSFELYKSGIPVQYGGRLSSIFEMLMRDGNQKKFSGQGGIGPITSHLTLELPLVKDRTTLMAGGRTTYSNWVLRTLPKSDIKNTKASFYDVFARLTHSPNDRNTIYLSLYASDDKFNLSSDTLFAYTNKLASFQWRHVFTPNLDAVLSVTHSDYDYRINYETVPEQAFNVGFSVAESNVKWNFSQSYRKHKLTYGVQGKLYQLEPGFIDKASESSMITERKVADEKGVESALFVADDIEISPKLTVYAGLRYSLFSVLGPRTIYSYNDGSPKAQSTIQDTLMYGRNKIIGNFHGPEYRTSLRYKLTSEASLKASYNKTRQYIHMLSNTVSVSPTDTWKLTDPNVKPQIGEQVSLGFYQDLRHDVFELSAEVYYKWIQNILDYKTGATLLVNENIDQQILQGRGKAYGLELFVRKKSGQLTGWLGYAYSRTFIQLASEHRTEEVNFGKYFPANYDKPHDVSVITNYKITRRYSVSANFVYSTGRPITYPVSAYRFGNSYRVNYSERNAFRIPDYVRADIGLNIEGNHKIKKLAHSFWTISIYNIFGRRNPYSIYFTAGEDGIKAYRLAIFGAPIPTITYHFKF